MAAAAWNKGDTVKPARELRAQGSNEESPQRKVLRAGEAVDMPVDGGGDSNGLQVVAKDTSE